MNLTLVVEVGLVVDVNTGRLPRNGLQKGRATGSRGSQDHQHLALVDNAVVAAQDVDFPLAHSHHLADDSGCFQQDICDILLVIRGGSKAVDIEVLEADTRRSETLSLAIGYVHNSLGPGARIKMGGVGVQRRILPSV